MRNGGESGFSLLELLVTVALAAILLGIGVPSFLDTFRNNRMAAASNDLLAAVHLARSEAVKRRAPVTVCTSADPLAPACTAGSLNGWVVFADDDGDGVAEASDGNNVIDANEDILNAHAPLDGGIQTLTTPAGASYVSFAGTGFPRTAGGNPAATVIRLCDERGNVNAGGGTSTARALQISITGRPQVLRTVPDVTAAGDCP
ncbi:MAG: GspH/FimT family pseudopilin [Gammaproteobacteria bacterium]